jgi:hypothetical protein
MSNIVIWVDEDERIWEPERRLLIGLGCNVVPISDATSALNFFRSQMDQAVVSLQMAIFDVMLLQGDNNQIFSDEKTNNGLNTGIVLAANVLEMVPGLRDRIILFSRSSNDDHTALIKRHASELGIKYIRKGPTTQGRYFVNWLIKAGFINPPNNRQDERDI